LSQSPLHRGGSSDVRDILYVVFPSEVSIPSSSGWFFGLEHTGQELPEVLGLNPLFIGVVLRTRREVGY